MKRRDFLRAIALTGAAAAVKPGKAFDVLTETGKSAETGAAYDMVAVMGGEPEAMFRRAIQEMGGMGQYVKKGQKVVIKPNIGWDKVPALAANTNPVLIGEIIKECFSAGASEVVVFDHTCDDWKRCYANSGIEAVAKENGAKVVPAHEESYYREMKLPNGKSLTSTKIHQAIMDCDVWINVPILKNHGGAKMSISMKNMMGIVWDRRFFHSNDLQQCIADVCTMNKRPVLNIVDAYRVLKSNGPRGKSAADVVTAKGLFMSTDMVAVDTAATKFFDQIVSMPLEHVGHIANAEKLKVGTTNLDNLKIKRIKL